MSEEKANEEVVTLAKYEVVGKHIKLFVTEENNLIMEVTKPVDQDMLNELLSAWIERDWSNAIPFPIYVTEDGLQAAGGWVINIVPEEEGHGTGHNCILIGKDCTSNFDNCILIGNNLVADHENQVIVGNDEFSRKRKMTDIEFTALFETIKYMFANKK